MTHYRLIWTIWFQNTFYFEQKNIATQTHLTQSSEDRYTTKSYQPVSNHPDFQHAQYFRQALKYECFRSSK